MIYQLTKHKKTPFSPIPLPDPTIDHIDGEDYLILTIADKNIPRVCFYNLSQNSDNRVLNEPSFELHQTIMYLKVDSDDSKYISVLSETGLEDEG